MGNVGIGPNFNSNNVPKADLHINTSTNDPGTGAVYEDAKIQLTIQQVTGESSKDGFHISTDQSPVTNDNGAAFLRQYENRGIRMMTATDQTGVTIGERMRITSVEDPAMGNQGSPAPSANTTRIGIPDIGATPLTRIRSVLHLGNNLDTDNDGWRTWMNVGTLSSNRNNHLYVGIGDPVPNTNYRSANIAWGASGYQIGHDQSGPMPLRFMFTSDFVGGQDYALAGGREVARIESNGWMGIGNTAPKNRLEISTQNVNDPYWSNNNMTPGQVGSSGLRFTRMRSSNLAVENPGDGVLSVDANGDVIYVTGGSTGGDDCRWVDYTDPFTSEYWGIATGVPSGSGWFSTPCNEMNVGIGSAPTNKEKLRVMALTNNLTAAVYAKCSYGNGGEFYGTNYG